MSLAFTLAAIAAVLLSIGAVVVLPLVLAYVGLGSITGRKPGHGGKNAPDTEPLPARLTAAGAKAIEHRKSDDNQRH
jgi:hypothetical protein